MAGHAVQGDSDLQNTGRTVVHVLNTSLHSVAWAAPNTPPDSDLRDSDQGIAVFL
ncbi:unnamed protein product [Ixodes persulcatus]